MHRDEGGQALVETAIVVPLFLFTFLVLLQLMLVAHARVLTDYAAFNACRAGVVHNGNKQAMRGAAFVSALPLFGDTHNFDAYLETWKTYAPAQTAGTAVGLVKDSASKVLSNLLGVNISLPGLEMVEVETLNPLPDHFKDDEGNELQEIDFDLPGRTDKRDLNALMKTRLTIRTRVLFHLRVPVAGRLLFYSYVLAMYFDRPEMSRNPITDILDPRVKTTTGVAGESSKKFIAEQGVPPPGTDLTKVADDTLTFWGLRALANLNIYVMPLYAFHSMPMESNFFKDNLYPGAVVP